MISEQQGDNFEISDESIVALYRLYWMDMYNTAFRILKDSQACEDIIQDVFVTLWNKRLELRINSSIKGYLISSVRHEVFRKLRKDKTFEPIAAEMAERFFENDFSEQLDYKNALKNIEKNVERLPEKCREVYRLSREEHLSHKEISLRLSISTKTVRNHLTRALRQLRAEGLEMIILTFFIFFFH